MASHADQRRLPADSVANLEVNTFWDGLFHASTYVFVAARPPRPVAGARSGRMSAGRASCCRARMLIGFGLFNVVEGIIDHHVLGIHHVNETVPRDQWICWDLGFLIWGAAMLSAAGSCCERGGAKLRPLPRPIEAADLEAVSGALVSVSGGLAYPALMPAFICTACGTQYPPSEAPPGGCPICTDERQFAPASGQSWTTLEKQRGAHSNKFRRLAAGLTTVETTPAFGIGQRAILARTPAGNVLWTASRWSTTLRSMC